MGMFHKVKVGDKIISPIDWEMNPDLSFGTYESWGGRERVRNNDECVYYFFVDNWGNHPKLCLMERAVKHAKIMAVIDAPKELIEECVAGQGSSSIFEKSYAINEQVKEWLIENVLDGADSAFVIPQVETKIEEDMGPPLTNEAAKNYSGERVRLPVEPGIIDDEAVGTLIRSYDFFDTHYNPQGSFENSFVADGSETVIDRRTGLMWQTKGLDIGSIRHIQRGLEQLNSEKFGGYNDWRLPTLEEAMSLLEPGKNNKDIYLHPCFSKEQPFIFVAAQRKPGGYWFVDFKQGRAFWASGTIPGGFGRFVRSVS